MPFSSVQMIWSMKVSDDDAVDYPCKSAGIAKVLTLKCKEIKREHIFQSLLKYQCVP